MAQGGGKNGHKFFFYVCIYSSPTFTLGLAILFHLVNGTSINKGEARVDLESARAKGLALSLDAFGNPVFTIMQNPD